MKRSLYFGSLLFFARLLPLYLVSMVASVLVLVFGNCARANVYATNIRLNGATTNVVVPPGGTTTISYILNEPATAAVIIQVKSGLNTIRTISLTNSPGTARGTNTVVWDGKDNASNPVPIGTYSIHITAIAQGYAGWTQITQDRDTNSGNYVWEPRGIAVNQNSNSPYYGRVFVGNAAQGLNPNSKPGDRLGLLKLNADGSAAAEGIFSDGGWVWGDDFISPWKIEVSEDDRVHVNDWSGNGVILSFDQTLSAASRQHVLRDDNWPSPAVNLSGPSITGSGTNTEVWMADITQGGVGIRRWSVSTNGVIATNDVGTTAVPSGGNSDLNVYPLDVAVDRSNAIYTIQWRTTPGDPAFRVLRFADSSLPQTVASWKIGAADDTMGGAHGIAIDPTGTYLAVAFQGVFSGGWTNGSVRVFYATNGANVATPTANVAGYRDYRDVAWDNVGNLYVIDTTASVWRSYSPPGANSATTVAAISIGTPLGTRPILSEPSYANGQFHCILTGQPNAVYYLEATTDLQQQWTVVATNSSPLARREITVPAPNHRSFYRAIAGQSATQPALSHPSLGGGQFHFTLTGEANVSYIIQASTNLQSWVSVATNNAANTTRQIDLPASAGRAFYRALRSQ
jgi:hypothetical protein